MKHITEQHDVPEIITAEQDIPHPAPVSSHPESKSSITVRSIPWYIIIVVVFSFGVASGYLLWGRATSNDSPQGAKLSANSSQGNQEELVTPVGQTNALEGYTMPVAYGEIGPQLLDAGAIDYERFEQIYERTGQPLTDTQRSVLKQGSDSQIVINKDNAYFLLNFFWALGLTNQNTVLTEGSMMQYGEDQIGRFASTGGWTVGTKPSIELYASTAIIQLTPDQQARLEEVASSVYRLCCNNPTSFPDCNHGMAMLGLLELMASQDATVDQMFEAAKYVNAFWFPQQTLELATFYKSAQGQDFAQVDPREIVGPNFSSSSGYRAVHQWLAENGVLEGTPGSGSSCGV